MRLPRLCALALVLATPMLCAGPARAQNSLTLSQTWSDADRFTCFVRFQYAEGGPVPEDLPPNPARVLVTMDGTPLQTVKSCSQFKDLGEGVAYTVLVDLSESVRREALPEIRASLKALAGRMQPKDQMSIVGFGGEVKVVSDFTGDQKALARAFEQLSAAGDAPLLFKALLTAFQMNQRREAGFPRRRAIFLIAGGRDEGSGLSFEDLFRDDSWQRVPVHCLGFRGTEADYGVLNRITDRSKGAFEPIQSPAEIAKKFAQAMDALASDYVFQVTYPPRFADGTTHDIAFGYTTRRGQRPADRDIIFLARKSAEQQIETPSAPPAFQPAKARPLSRRSPKFLQRGFILSVVLTGLLVVVAVRRFRGRK